MMLEWMVLLGLFVAWGVAFYPFWKESGPSPWDGKEGEE